jgi:alpha-galactosidase
MRAISVLRLICLIASAPLLSALGQDVPWDAPGAAVMGPEILTPASPPTPEIHGAKVFGVRPGSPFLYSMPVTGERPMEYSADGLPAGLLLDGTTGRITGSLSTTGTYAVTFHAKNHLGQAERGFKIVVGDEVGLTPALGWNSFNTYGVTVSQSQVLAAAHAMVDSGLAEHGWNYVNTDDGWQGERGGDFNAIQPNSGFPDIAGMVKEIHGLGLKAGIYSTPWVTSYGKRIGGSSEDPKGKWDTSFEKANPNNHSQQFPFAIAKYHFDKEDAKQFAKWGFDYLKYDWAPIHAPDVKEMYEALRASGRDIVFSLSNNGLYTLLTEIGGVSPYANSWRTTDDVHDKWQNVSNSAFTADAWAPYSRPGHFNDPDMLVVGVIGWGHPHPTRLSADEQYTQISMWSLLSAPLILGCDLRKLDPFTKGLITNDDVLDVDQDSLGKQATRVATYGDLNVYAKPLEDGSWAVGLVNRGIISSPVILHWEDIHLDGPQEVRDLWRQKDIGVFNGQFVAKVEPHGVVLVRVTPSK